MTPFNLKIVTPDGLIFDGEAEELIVRMAITGEDGRRTIELITGIFKSGALGQTIDLPLQKDDPFYTVEGIMQNVPHFYEKTTSAADLGGEITLGSTYKK